MAMFIDLHIFLTDVSDVYLLCIIILLFHAVYLSSATCPPPHRLCYRPVCSILMLSLLRIVDYHRFRKPQTSSGASILSVETYVYISTFPSHCTGPYYTIFRRSLHQISTVVRWSSPSRRCCPALLSLLLFHYTSIT